MIETSNARAFITAFSSAVDARSGSAVAEFFAPDGTFTFGNMPALQGRAAIAAGNDQFFGSIGGLRHDIREVWDVDGTIIAQLIVSYTRRDGSTVALPSVNIVRRAHDGTIAAFQVYMDVAPVFNPEVQP